MVDIMLGNQSIGKGEIHREGMYYRIHCRCRLSGEVPCQVEARAGGKTFDLGLLVPENGAFCLTRRLPIKEIGTGELTLRAMPKSTVGRGKFVPISADEPFSYLSRLENAYLARKDGVVGAYIEDKSRVSPTGQWSEPGISE